jgi:hypothetical protein
MVSAMCLTSGLAIAQDGSHETMPPELRALMQKEEMKKLAPALATMPLQMRTAYAVGGLERCETVVSLSNFSDDRTVVEVEFFTGFNAFQRGIAQLQLAPGETGEIATAQPVSPFVINAVRNSAVAFEGYANIHAKTPDIGAHAHMVCGARGQESYQDINVFRARKGRPTQDGD